MTDPDSLSQADVAARVEHLLAGTDPPTPLCVNHVTLSMLALLTMATAITEACEQCGTSMSSALRERLMRAMAFGHEANDALGLVQSWAADVKREYTRRQAEMN